MNKNSAMTEPDVQLSSQYLSLEKLVGIWGGFCVSMKMPYVQHYCHCLHNMHDQQS